MAAPCLESRTKDCQNCYKCIRHCPVKAISFASNKASIIHEDCILCGRCYIVCPQELKVVRNDEEKIKTMLKEHDVIASVAPSFIANYGVSFETLRKAMLELGFKDVEETAIGATITKRAYDDLLNKGEVDVLISSCCHSINLLIQKHYKEALPYLAKVDTPMLAHAKDIKKRLGEDKKVVFVGPCIAKIDEADHEKELDGAITFLELDHLFEEKGIVFKEENEEPIKEHSKARLFPITGGVIQTMNRDAKQYNYVFVDGVEEVKRVLEDVIAHKIHHTFIEVNACHGGCVNGPIINTKTHNLATSSLRVLRSAGTLDFEEPIIKSEDVKHEYAPYAINHARPSEKEIEETFKKMDKKDPKNRLNCGSCGYDSCLEKAIAIIQGKAVVEMCLPFLMAKAQSFSDKIVANSPNGLMVIDENFKIQLINHAMCMILGVHSPRDLIQKDVSLILDTTPFSEALGGERVYERKMYLTAYNKYVNLTVTYDEKYHILIVLMRDITKVENEHAKRLEIVQKSVDITDEVIKKNMRAVQEIASLLGESAAETKVALNSLKETLEEKDD